MIYNVLNLNHWKPNGLQMSCPWSSLQFAAPEQWKPPSPCWDSKLSWYLSMGGMDQPVLSGSFLFRSAIPTGSQLEDIEVVILILYITCICCFASNFALAWTCSPKKCGSPWVSTKSCHPNKSAKLVQQVMKQHEARSHWHTVSTRRTQRTTATMTQHHPTMSTLVGVFSLETKYK